MKITLAIAKGIALAVLVIVITGCTLTVAPDGSRTYKPDESSILRVAQIIADK